VEFPDEPHTIPAWEIDNYCNQVGYGGFSNNGSVRDYFSDVSDSNLTYTNFVPAAYYMASHPKTYYEDPNVLYGLRAMELIVEALHDLNDSGFNFAPYDSDGNGNIDAINCFYAGTRAGPWSVGLWPHRGWLHTIGPYSFAADGVRAIDYQITDITNSLRLRTFCHENGHMLCHWNDLYDYGQDSNGVGIEAVDGIITVSWPTVLPTLIPCNLVPI